MRKYRAEDLQRYAANLLVAGGFSLFHAERTADVLVWANTRGADSHGVLRIPRYIEMVQQGKINPVAVPVLTKREGAVSLIEADRAPGASAMIDAMNEALSSAAQFGIGWCAARNISHAGAIGFYIMEATRRGYIGITMTASRPLMAYHGSRVAGVSTNPIAIGAPSHGDPILLDMSTSTVALGKVMAAKDAKTRIPSEWGIDADGRPTTDPAGVATLTPVGGAKGSSLSLLIEILSSLLVSNPVISVALAGKTAGMNGLALALKVGALVDLKLFRDDVGILAESIHSLPKAPGTEAILLPGERGFKAAKRHQIEGIAVADVQSSALPRSETASVLSRRSR